MSLLGYSHPAYAASLRQFGEPLRLPRSGSSVLVRTAASDPVQHDAMGPYPLFACQDWAALAADLAELDLVSLTVIVDPFGDWTLEQLRECFPDRLTAFKQHFVADLRGYSPAAASAHHRRNVRRALTELEVEHVAAPTVLLDDWEALYRQLIARHGITGIAAFSGESFAAQLALPGMHAFRASRGGETAGIVLWLRADRVVYYHLGAYSEAGYGLGASFALFARALEHFADLGVEWASLGAGAGAVSEGDDGLSRFKRGWASGTRTAWLGGRILRPDSYAELAGTSPERTSYFPAYRAGEFA